MGWGLGVECVEQHDILAVFIGWHRALSESRKFLELEAEGGGGEGGAFRKPPAFVSGISHRAQLKTTSQSRCGRYA